MGITETVSLRLPDLAMLGAWLEQHGSEDFAVQAATAFGSQRDDGSWGEADVPGRRVLPTLWMAKALAELGYAQEPAWSAAAQWLASDAATDGGVFSLDARTDGVRSCYVGLAGHLYLTTGHPEQARPQLDWIVRYQDVRCSGHSRREQPVPVYSPDLAWRYGGCLASTTCLVGLVKCGLALLAARQSGVLDDAGETLLNQVVDVLLERELFKSSSGEPLPLGTPARRPDEWLLPTYPLDWRTDLIEVVHLVVHARGADPRLQPALDVLAVHQRPDGSWPLRRTFRPPYLPLLERRSRSAGSVVVSRRVRDALAPLAASPRGPQRVG